MPARLLSPEAEVTKSLSSNLIKTFYQDFSQKETRVLDMNELVQERIEAVQTKMKNHGNQGFVAGLNAEEVAVAGENVEAALSDEEAAELSSNIIKAANKDAEELKAQAEAGAQRIIDDARAKADEILSQASKQAELDRDKVYNEAKTQGYEEGRKQAEKENELIRGELDRTRRDLKKDYEKRLEELEPDFIDTITGIYEHIFNIELSSYREILAYLIEGAMRNIEGRSLLVHVSKEDYPYISMQKKQLVSESVSSSTEVDIVEDASLSKNECFIETEAGIFDCGLGTQLSELSQKLKLLSYEKQQ
jgi:flagellar assembly protein FliH